MIPISLGSDDKWMSDILQFISIISMSYESEWIERPNYWVPLFFCSVLSNVSVAQNVTRFNMNIRCQNRRDEMWSAWDESRLLIAVCVLAEKRVGSGAQRDFRNVFHSVAQAPTQSICHNIASPSSPQCGYTRPVSDTAQYTGGKYVYVYWGGGWHNECKEVWRVNATIDTQ